MNRLESLMSLHGRCALITGGGGHIGQVMAETLLELGGEVILVDRCKTSLENVKRALGESREYNILTIKCDLEIEQERRRLIRTLISDGAHLDILINNAAFVGTSDLSGWNTPFAEQSIETWRRAIEVNVTAAFHLVRDLTPLLKVSGHGAVINVGSIYAEHAPNWALYEGTSMGNPAAYGVSKSGLLQLTRWLATSLAPHVRVNAISPGGVARNQPKAFSDRYNAATPMARMATEDDFRGATAYLASDLSAYVTGQILRVDGGWGIW